jgi:hypothetical protein
MEANPRHALYDRAIDAGHLLKEAGALPDWWPELAPLTMRERFLVYRAVRLGAKASDKPEPPEEPAEAEE